MKVEKIYDYISERIPVELFDEIEIAELLKCQICSKVPLPEKALETECCHKIYCEKCSDLVNYECHCKSNLSNDIQFNYIKRSNQLLYRILISLNIKCPYNCNWKGTLEKLSNHLDSCKFKVDRCKYHIFGCDYIGSLSNIIIHINKNKDKHLALVDDCLNKYNISLNKK